MEARNQCWKTRKHRKARWFLENDMGSEQTKRSATKLLQAFLLSVISIIALCSSAYAANFDATVPASLPIAVSADGTITTATNTAIHNYSSSNIVVSSINVTAQNGWTLATKTTASSSPVGSKVIAMGFNGSWMNASGVVSTSKFGRIAANSSLGISYDAKIPRGNTSESETIAATVTFVVGLPSPPTILPHHSWYKSTSNGKNITKITFMDSYTPTTSPDETWIADVNGTGDITCYRNGTEIIIAGNGTGKIKANADSQYMFSNLGLFSNFTALTAIANLNLLDTSNVTRMQYMFYECGSLSNLDLSNFDTSNVTDMSGMFSDCKNLTRIDVSNFNTTKVTDMSMMFDNCYKLVNLDLSHFDTSQVTDMRWMFYDCKSLTSLDVSNFNTSNVTDMRGMFNNCKKLVGLNLSNFDTSHVTSMNGLFFDCEVLTSLNLSNFNTVNVTDMASMFQSCRSLVSLDVSHLNTSNVTTMENMFSSCKNLDSLDLSNFNTSNVTTMEKMFYECEALSSLKLSNFNTSKVTSMQGMFQECSSLSYLDLSNFNTQCYKYEGNV